MVGATVHKDTYKFLEHALVKRSFGFPTPVVFLRIWCEPSVQIPQSEAHLVIGLQAIPMLIELLETVLPHLSDPNGPFRKGLT